jgi:hypothetical protein
VIDLVDTEVCLVIETRRHSEVLAEMLKIARTVPPSEYSGLTDAGPASVGT